MNIKNKIRDILREAVSYSKKQLFKAIAIRVEGKIYIGKPGMWHADLITHVFSTIYNYATELDENGNEYIPEKDYWHIIDNYEIDYGYIAMDDSFVTNIQAEDEGMVNFADSLAMRDLGELREQFLIENSKRGEKRWIIDADTKETLAFSDEGLDIKDEWQVNVNIDTTPFWDMKYIDIHTHPDNSWFSMEDIIVFLNEHAQEFRVVTKNNKVIVLKKQGSDWKNRTPKRIREIWNKYEDEIFETKQSLEMSAEDIIKKLNLIVAEQASISITEHDLSEYKNEPWTQDV